MVIRATWHTAASLSSATSVMPGPLVVGRAPSIGPWLPLSSASTDVHPAALPAIDAATVSEYVVIEIIGHVIPGNAAVIIMNMKMRMPVANGRVHVLLICRQPAVVQPRVSAQHGVESGSSLRSAFPERLHHRIG